LLPRVFSGCDDTDAMVTPFIVLPPIANASEAGAVYAGSVYSP